nr:hypothetical protein [Tanacetum cinerariifolium]
MSFLRDLGHTRKIHSLNDVVVDQMHQPWRTFTALINRSLSGKTTGATSPKKAQKFKKPASPKLTTVPVSTEAPTRKTKRVKRLTKKSTETPARDDSHNDQDSSNEDSEQENDSDDNSDSDHETEENELSSESNHEEDEDDEEEVKDESVKTPSNDFDDENETKIADKAEVDTDKGFIQDEGVDAAKTNKTEVPVTNSFHSSDLAAKFLNFLDIPHSDAEIVSPMAVHVQHEVQSQQTPILLTVPVSVILDSS